MLIINDLKMNLKPLKDLFRHTILCVTTISINSCLIIRVYPLIKKKIFN